MGANGVRQDVKGAHELSRLCVHPSAQWFYKAHDGERWLIDPTTDVRSHFMEQKLGSGYILAMAATGDLYALFLLGRLWEKPISLRRLASLGYHDAARYYANHFCIYLSSEWFYWAFTLTQCHRNMLPSALKQLASLPSSPHTFYVGMRLCTDMHRACLLPGVHEATVALRVHYGTMVTWARVACITWFLCARRLHVVKDVARIIAKMVWNSKGSEEWYATTK